MRNDDGNPPPSGNDAAAPEENGGPPAGAAAAAVEEEGGAALSSPSEEVPLPEMEVLEETASAAVAQVAAAHMDMEVAQVEAEEKVLAPMSEEAVWEQLDLAEERIARILGLAADTCEQLSKFGSVDVMAVQGKVKEVVDLTGQVKSCLTQHADRIKDYIPSDKDEYAARRTESLLQQRADYLESELALFGHGSMSSY